MRRFGVFILLLALAVGARPAASQGRTITGHVFDAVTSAPLGRAQITLKGTETGTLSKDDGSYTLAAPAGDVTLVVHLIGYKRREVTATAPEEAVNIQLERDVLQLEAVVITGQATGQERRNRLPR